MSLIGLVGILGRCFVTGIDVARLNSTYSRFRPMEIPYPWPDMKIEIIRNSPAFWKSSGRL